jgi:eukaryotic-like serine/threonine-protein kinase
MDMENTKISPDTLKQWFKDNSKIGLAIHAALIALLVAIVALGFFYIYLPNATNHGQTLTVPDLSKMTITEVESYLENVELRFEVSDSGYNSDFPPLTVIAQYPLPEATVKLNRKIYLTLNRANPPTVKLPNILDGSLKNAELIFGSLDLRIGEVKYVPDLATNAVLKIFVDGKEITKEQIDRGKEVVKGQVIDMEVGNGLGNSQMIVPDLVGMPLEEVEQYLLGIGLGVGRVQYVDTVGVELGVVIRQNPKQERGTVIQQGDIIDLWVAGFYPEEGEEEEDIDEQ